ANLKIMNKPLGFLTDRYGAFMTKDLEYGDSIIISALGYKEFRVQFGHPFKNNDSFVLNRQIFDIPEVVVYSNQPQIFENKQKKERIKFYPSKGFQVISRITLPNAVNKIDKIEIMV